MLTNYGTHISDEKDISNSESVDIKKRIMLEAKMPDLFKFR